MDSRVEGYSILKEGQSDSRLVSRGLFNVERGNPPFGRWSFHREAPGDLCSFELRTDPRSAIFDAPKKRHELMTPHESAEFAVSVHS
jgi:hypothetical protein